MGLLSFISKRHLMPAPFRGLGKATSPIGSRIDPPAAYWALGVGLATVAVDWLLFGLARYPESSEGRWALALTSCAVQVRLAQGHLPSLGLAAPVQGWGRWARIGSYLLCVVAGIAAMVFMIWMYGRRDLPDHLMSPQTLRSAFVPMCVLYPLLEESIYRGTLCIGVAAISGERWAIVLSGIAFAVLHWIYGNVSPENQLGGFVLAWAFVRSGSIAVPLILHAGGNGLVWLAHLGANLWLVP